MKNTNHQKYRTITNICQVNGVSPEQLLDQCRYLIRTIPASYGLSSEDIATAINDAVTYVWLKMQQGVLPKYDYSQFKGYLYLTLKNEVFKAYNKNNTHQSFMISDIELENADFDHNIQYSYTLKEGDDDDKLKQRQIMKQALSGFSSIEQYIITTEDSYKIIMSRYPEYHKQRIANLRRTYFNRCRKAYNKPLPTKRITQRIKKGRRKKNELKQQVIELYSQGLTKQKIAQHLNVSKSLISYYTNDEYNQKAKQRSLNNYNKTKLKEND